MTTLMIGGGGGSSAVDVLKSHNSTGSGHLSILSSVNSSILNGVSGNSCNSPANKQQQRVNANYSHRLVEKYLEEAQHTGDVLLNGKNLSEFPSKLVAKFDLSDTITAGNLKNEIFPPLQIEINFLCVVQICRRII